MNRGQLRDVVKDNLGLNGITNGYLTDADLNELIQDVYNYTVAKSLCYIKNSGNKAWQDYTNYYSLSSLAITDFLGVFAIFNNVTNRWLRDDITYRSLGDIRDDWEMWLGNPDIWIPMDFRRILIVPRHNVSTGTFAMDYYASAPILSADTDNFVIPSDSQDLLEQRVTALALEECQEQSMAVEWFNEFDRDFETFKERCKKLAKDQLRIRAGESTPWH